MKAFGATVPLSPGWVDRWTKRDRNAEKRVGGEGGIGAADTAGAETNADSVGTTEDEAFRSGIRRGCGLVPVVKEDAMGMVRRSWGADGSRACSMRSLNGVQK
jgi:hypothetical protein